MRALAGLSAWQPALQRQPLQLQPGPGGRLGSPGLHWMPEAAAHLHLHHTCQHMCDAMQLHWWQDRRQQLIVDLIFDTAFAQTSFDVVCEDPVIKMQPDDAMGAQGTRLHNHCHRNPSSNSISILHTSLSSLRLQQAADRLLRLLQNSHMVLQQLAQPLDCLTFQQTPLSWPTPCPGVGPCSPCRIPSRSVIPAFGIVGSDSQCPRLW